MILYLTFPKDSGSYQKLEFYFLCHLLSMAQTELTSKLNYAACIASDNKGNSAIIKGDIREEKENRPSTKISVIIKGS